MSDNAFVSFLKNNRGLWRLGVLLLVGVGLLLFGTLTTKESAQTETSSLDEYRAAMEKELAEFLSGVSGVGECRVLITLSRGEGKEYAGGELVSVTGAEVHSITVVCEGAGRDEVRRRLTEMLSAQFDIGANRVSILPIK